MTTVKEIKEGASIDKPIYVSQPYVILGKRERVVLHAGTLETIKEIWSYYDDCDVEIRRYDLYGNDNTKVAEQKKITYPATIYIKWIEGPAGEDGFWMATDYPTPESVEYKNRNA